MLRGDPAKTDVNGNYLHTLAAHRMARRTNDDSTGEETPAPKSRDHDVVVPLSLGLRSDRTGPVVGVRRGLAEFAAEQVRLAASSHRHGDDRHAGFASTTAQRWSR